jgi:hypothetical protein
MSFVVLPEFHLTPDKLQAFLTAAQATALALCDEQPERFLQRVVP